MAVITTEGTILGRELGYYQRPLWGQELPLSNVPARARLEVYRYLLQASGGTAG